MCYKMNTKQKNIVTFSTIKGKSISKEQAKEIVEGIKTLLRDKEIKKIAQIEFKDKLSYNKYNINFNGKSKKDFETFTFYTEYKNSSTQEVAEAITDKTGTYNNIKRIVHLDGTLEECRCWTNSKPYTKVVIMVLDMIQKITKNALKIEWS